MHGCLVILFVLLIVAAVFSGFAWLFAVAAGVGMAQGYLFAGVIAVMVLWLR